MEMEKLSLNTLREEFLKFFESKGHLRLKSFSLIPEDDPSILLINAGMTPLKPYFTGALKPPSKRITTCQKCIRTLDIDRVGITTRHGTFFEMLGNFSFGDYFKKEAIQWSWEFFTEVLKMDKNLLYASVYEEDDEAYDIWKNIVKLDESHIVRMGKEDNFWEHGTGPCGPCSEIYYDRGEDKGCGSKDCKVGCDCDRFVEVWNNVFTQFDKQEDGTYKPLKNKNIDTGMGLERLACVVQGVDSIFEVDTVKDILDFVCNATSTEYGKDQTKDISIRVITDHIRSSVMMISDGIIPSNEGRGYVLRRLLRRASRHGRLLGKKDAFLSELIDVVINNSKSAYPELEEKRDYILKVVQSEEAKFINTIENGMNILNQYLEEAENNKKDTLAGEHIFKLHDTYGFPYDLTREIASERGFKLDKEGFDEYMQNQKKTARDAFKADEGSAWHSDENIYKNIPKTEFSGYEKLEIKAEVLSFVKKDETAELVTDKTVFYAEGGGQQADIGVITDKKAKMTVTDVINREGIFIHRGVMEQGNFSDDETVTLKVDKSRRKATERNHTATHMLHYALREVLGNHVHQAGSYVDHQRLRFDFTHFSAMDDRQLMKVVSIVNNIIMEDIDVVKEIMDMDTAKKKGATALFGEKYSDKVRVVSIHPYSMELCGGTHLSKTGETGLFTIVSEGAVASGVRRIEALTGANAIEYMQKLEDTVNQLNRMLKGSDVIARVENLSSTVRELRKENEELKNKLSANKLDNVINTFEQYKNIKIVSAVIENADMQVLRNLSDKARERYDDCVCVFVSTGEKVSMVIAATKKAVTSGVNAGTVIKEAAALIGGSGGGRPDMAQAGGKDSDKAHDAVQKAVQLIKEAI
ncbi:MAG: Alanine--tRNA ligase [Firmicutes bacterium ADurb.Bin099]|nr:MAG: Alanine--tRNA ligase [Firmicutes bacterium ADurb.Bin099]